MDFELVGEEEGMIVFERFGHTFEIPDDDWKILRKRFNIDNAIKEYDGWKIPIPCSLCDKHDSYCPSCPMHMKIAKGGIGYAPVACSWFFDKLFPRIRRFETYKFSVSWDKKDNTTVCKQLNRMQKIMDEIEKENIKENQHETKTKLTRQG